MFILYNIHNTNIKWGSCLADDGTNVMKLLLIVVQEYISVGVSMKVC